ncbi:MAG: ferritin family protein [Thermodesulfovibrionales bacterium]
MEKYSVREVVEQAVRTEKLGYEFYTSMMLRFADNKPLQEFFGGLAKQEKEHEKVFLALEGTIKNDESTDWEEVSLYLRAIVESEFFLGKNKSLPGLEQVRTIREAVTFAIGFEKETLLYFYALQEVVQEKDIVGKIIAEEKSHIIALRNFEQSLT